jgi:hypothetical protein
MRIIHDCPRSLSDLARDLSTDDACDFVGYATSRGVTVDTDPQWVEDVYEDWCANPVVIGQALPSTPHSH